MPSYLRMGLACSLGLTLQLCLPLLIATSGVLQWLPAPLTAVITPFYANLLLSSTLTGLIVGRWLPGQYVQATLLILGATTLVTLIHILMDPPTGMRMAELLELHAANLQAICYDLVTSAAGLLLGAWLGSRRQVKAIAGSSDRDRPGTEPPAGA